MIENNEIQRLVRHHTLDENQSDLQLLPSMHSTSCHKAESIFKSGKLSVTYCHVFKEKFLYLFYGKPVYKVSEKNREPRTDFLFSPSCFIIDTKKISSKHNFPFDTGAFHQRKYGGLFPNDVELSSYELPLDIEQIPKFINLFYGSNTKYLEGICCIADNHLTNSVSEFLGGLLKSAGITPFDDRAKTVEIISDEDVSISEAVLAFIVPKPFLRNEYFITFVKQNPHIDIITYFTHYPTDPCSHNEVVFQKAVDYLIEKGCV